MPKPVIPPLASAQMRSRQTGQPVYRNWLGVCIGLLVGIPLLTFHYSLLIGVYINSLCAALLVWLALRYAPAHKVALAGALLPVAYMLPISSASTLQPLRTAYLYIGLSFLSIAYYHPFQNKFKKHSRLSPFGYLIAIPVACALGAALGTAGYLTLHGIGIPNQVPVGWLVAYGLFFAGVETLYFHGLLQATASRIMRPVYAAMLSAVLYTCAYTTTTPSAVALAAVSGIIFSGLYQISRSTVLPLAANITMKLLYVSIVLLVR